MDRIHTKITQMHVTDLTTAISIFGTKASDGSMPLILVPQRRKMGDFLISVPANVYCLLQKDGQAAGLLEQGIHRLIAPRYRVVYAVSKQSSTYDAPIQACPTRDNVMVNVDVVLIFKIVDPEAFAYNLGATRFDELLTGNVEEAIRDLIRSKESNQIYELRGSQVSGLLTHLIEKFKSFGVSFTQAKITNIELPGDFASTLERTTVFTEKIKAEQKNFEFEQQNLQNRINLAQQEQIRKNDITLVNKKEEQNRALIQQSTEVTKASQDRNTRRIKAEEQAKILMMKAKARLAQEVVDMEREARMRVTQAEANLSRAKREAETEVVRAKAMAEAMIKEAEATAAGIRAMAEAEGEASEMLKKKRVHDIQIQRKAALAEIAEKSKLIISDQAGRELLKDMGMNAGDAADVVDMHG